MFCDVFFGVVNEFNGIVIKFCQILKVGIFVFGRERVDVFIVVVEVGKQGVGF